MSCLTDRWFSKSSSDELFWVELMIGRITAPKLDLIGIGRQTDENGKSVVPISVDVRYSWVKGESIAELGDPGLFVQEGSGLELQFLPCSEQDRVYHPGEGWEYFFVYTTLFLDIGVRFPFSEFECGAKGVRKGGTVILNRVQGKALFGLYRQSYKDFKEMYVKVTCAEDQFPFYLDEYGLERFPLYWYSEPVQILGISKVSRESLEVIEFLENHVCTKELFSLTMVFKWDNEREYAMRYLETTTGGLKNFFKSRAERGHSASNVIKAEERVVVNQPPEKRRVPSMKRRRAEEGGSNKKAIDLTSTKCCRKEVSLEEVKCITERQKRLHGYAGEEDLTSVWSEHFPISVVAEENFQSKTDLDLIGSVDSITRAQFMQVYAARLLCIGRYEELKAKEEAEQKKEKGLEVQKAIEAEKKLQVVTKQLSLKENEVLELKSDIESLKRKLQKVDKDKTDLEARVVELCVEKKELETNKENHGYTMLEIGFERVGSRQSTSTQT
ncbi:hypothetical protein PIB30_004068 [Stylosanthes scabra]|uniref:Uncharacterized protein n=1 Tax=Stylosanthes scabra TaxID=79078 RepID=A0ABU6Y414_9FABA|nr:hypothetical protein [Stylosanthes scabra]